MTKPELTEASLVARAYKIRVEVGLPHWYAMLNPLQDDGFGGITCAPAGSNEFVFSFVYEGVDCGAPYYETGHA